MLVRFLWLLLPLWVWAGLAPIQIAPADDNLSKHPHFRLLDSVIVSFDRIDGQKFYGISALAYDAGTRTLYMLNDRSRLFAFRLTVQDDKITALKPLFAKRLKDRNGHRYFRKAASDSEGMGLVDIGGQTLFLVSFEREPRVVLFDMQGDESKLSGYKKSGNIKERVQLTQLPEILQNPRHYRKRNSMLESVTFHPAYGMITTPEFPLRHSKAGLHGIYNAKGRICYIRHSDDMAITELETMPDGTLLALERGVELGKQIRIGLGLTKIYPGDIRDGICRSESLLHVWTDDGWVLDNFEGVTYLGDNRYLMVSDDNGNFFQQTILVLFTLR